MALHTETKEIGGLEVTVTQLPYFKAQRLAVRLLRLAGAQLTALFVLLGASGSDARQALAALGGLKLDELAGLLGGLFQALEPDDAESLTKQILATTQVRHGEKLVALVGGGANDRGVADAVLPDLWTGLAVQAFALSVVFGNFSSARGAFGDMLPGPFPSEASTTSTDGRDESLSGQGGAPRANSIA